MNLAKTQTVSQLPCELVEGGVTANLTKDRKDSSGGREIPLAVFFAETVFPPAPVAPLSFCAGKSIGRCPFRGATAIANLPWHAAIVRRGCARQAGSIGVQDLRRPACPGNPAALNTFAARAKPLPIVSRVRAFRCEFSPRFAGTRCCAENIAEAVRDRTAKTWQRRWAGLFRQRLRWLLRRHPVPRRCSTPNS